MLMIYPLEILPIHLQTIWELSISTHWSYSLMGVVYFWILMMFSWFWFSTCSMKRYLRNANKFSEQTIFYAIKFNQKKSKNLSLLEIIFPDSIGLCCLVVTSVVHIWVLRARIIRIKIQIFEPPANHTENR